MRLVPRQLQRADMTGTVPYYGGRLSPAQAYAVTHSAELAASQGQPGPTPPAAPAAGDLTDKLATLQQLLADGILTEDEYRGLRERVLQ